MATPGKFVYIIGRKNHQLDVDVTKLDLEFMQQHVLFEGRNEVYFPKAAEGFKFIKFRDMRPSHVHSWDSFATGRYELGQVKKDALLYLAIKAQLNKILATKPKSKIWHDPEIEALRETYGNCNEEVIVHDIDVQHFEKEIDTVPYGLDCV